MHVIVPGGRRARPGLYGTVARRPTNASDRAARLRARSDAHGERASCRRVRTRTRSRSMTRGAPSWVLSEFVHMADRTGGIANLQLVIQVCFSQAYGGKTKVRWGLAGLWAYNNYKSGTFPGRTRFIWLKVRRGSRIEWSMDVLTYLIPSRIVPYIPNPCVPLPGRDWRVWRLTHVCTNC